MAQVQTRMLLSIEEAAEAIGVSRTSIYEFMESDGLPYTRIGRRRKIPRARLEAWIEARTLARPVGAVSKKEAGM